MRNIRRFAPAGLVFAAHGAAAMELDTLLPPGIPGFGAGPAVSILDRVQPGYAPLGIQLDGIEFDPRFSLGSGYDSAPDGTGAPSPLLNLQSSLMVKDTPLGFGAYFSAGAALTPSAPRADTTSYSIAIGQGAVFPAETFAFGAAALRGTVNEFSLDPRVFDKPEAYTVEALTAGDAITAGIFTLTPKLSVSQAGFGAFKALDVTDLRESLLVDAAPGGPAHLVTLAETEQATYQDPRADDDQYALLAGIEDDATGLWDIRVLAGAASRQPAAGRAEQAPVLEATAAWEPDELDSFSLGLAREIDDPEQISAAGYTLSEADFSAAHEYLRNVDLTADARLLHADYFEAGFNETSLHAGAAVIWRLNEQFGLTAAYGFNTRQANFAGTANEHIVTLTAAWTP